QANGGKATVKKYTGSSWVDVGSGGISAGETNYSNIVLDANGTPFIAYVDYANNNRATVKKYNGSSWVEVGQGGLSAGKTESTRLVLDANGTPFVVYVDKANNYKATVRKFNGNGWMDVGTAGFSIQDIKHTSIALDAKGNPYVAYWTSMSQGKAMVKKFNGNSWVNVGPEYVSTGQVFYTNIAVDAYGTPFVVYEDIMDNDKATVKKFDGNSWVDVGAAGFSAGSVSFTSIALDAKGTPYVAYVDFANDQKATVMKFPITPPSITFAKQPVASTIIGGQNTNFTVVASGEGSLTYQWQVSQDGGANFTNIDNNHIYSGATTANLSLTLVPTTMNGYQYRVQVIRYGIIATSNIVATSNAVALTVQLPVTDNTKLTITTQPKATTITGGQNASFTVIASGEGLTYQWQEKRGNGDFVNISNSNVYNGATSATLTLTKAPISMNGYQYRVILSNGETSISNEAVLTVNVLPFDNDQVWQAVGADQGQVSEKDGLDANLALDVNGTPFIVYMDEANGYKATVKKFNGSNWVNVGKAGFSAGQANKTRIALDANGTPVVAYVDKVHGERATVMKFNGSSWEAVGVAGFSPGAIDYPSLVLDANGNPLVAYMEKAGDTYLDIMNGQKATVMKFNGSSWEIVGNAGFSAGRISSPSLALDANDTPFVAYLDNANGNKATVKKFNGSNWETVGVAGFSPEQAPMTTMAIDNNGIPYVAFMDYTFPSYDKMNQMATVMKFDGRNWVTVGEARFSAAGISTPSIVLDASGTPFVAYSDQANGGKTTVMKFNGTNWVYVGNAGFSAVRINNVGSLVLDANGNPCVAFTNLDYGNGWKATVMKFGDKAVPVTVPIIKAISEDTGISATDKITSDQNLMISGSAKPSALIRVYKEGIALPGTVTTNSEGKWTYDYTSTTLEEGKHTFTASATINDKTSALSGTYAIIVDITKPAPPAKLNFVTNQEHLTPPIITGSAEANSTVKLYYGNTEVGSALADNTGNWEIVIGTTLAEGTYNFMVVAIDAAGNMSEPSNIKYVHHINEAPKGLILSRSDLDENNQIGATIGTISSLDQDADDSHTYTLVPGNGDTDNNLFTIDGNTLKAAKVFDYEEKNNFHIRIQTRDSGGLTFETTEVITINDLQESTITVPEENEKVKVGPNPANAYLLISSEKEIEYITLVNIYGGTVFGKKGNSKQIRLNIESLESGVYTVLIYSNGEVFVRRIVVVK
ncbi:MAG: Ig-like domain-containing protein, partial [Bacteroidota bacterium]|nr:Ig-like domain-containing protein [Bacteroidota bacterium]